MQSWVKVLITTFLLGGSVQSFAEENVKRNTCFKKSTAEIREENDIFNTLNTLYKHYPLLREFAKQQLEYAKQQGTSFAYATGSSLKENIPILLEYTEQKAGNAIYATGSSLKKNLPTAITDSITYEGGLAVVSYLFGMNPFSALAMTVSSVVKYGVRFMCFDLMESQGYEDYKLVCYLVGGPTGYGVSSYMKGRGEVQFNILKGVINNGMYGLFREGFNKECSDASNTGQLKCAGYFTFIEGTEGVIDAVSYSLSFKAFEPIKNAVFAHTDDIKGGLGTGLVVYLVGENFLVPRFSESLKEGVKIAIQTLEELAVYPSRSVIFVVDLANCTPVDGVEEL